MREDKTEHNMPKHLDTEFVPYLEGKLSEYDSKRVEEHLQECPECRKEMEETLNIIQTLEKTKNLFCPSSAQIYDYAARGIDPNGAVANHLQECETCRAEYAQYCNMIGTESLPPQLWFEIKSRLDTANECVSSELGGSGVGESLIDSLFHWLRPTLTIPALAGAVLVAIFLYQGSIHDEMVGYTSVAWENVPQPKDVSDSERRHLLVVFLFEGFSKPFPRDKVDALYRAIAPSIDIMNRYRVESPMKVSEVLRSARGRISSRQDVYRVLAGKWRGGLALTVTIAPSPVGLSMYARLHDLQSDGEIRAAEATDLPSKDAENSVRELVYKVFTSEP